MYSFLLAVWHLILTSVTTARYIYIPLGGNERVVLNSVIVFSFVALWHDLSFKLLAWGWLVCLFILPELVARWALAEDVVRTPSLLRSLPISQF